MTNTSLIKNNRLALLALTVLIGSSFILIARFPPFIPDYDGLNYFTAARLVNDWLFLQSDLGIPIPHTDHEVLLWPISNALSVFMAALSYNNLPKNHIPALINSFYLIAFFIYISKMKSARYALILITIVCSHTFFFRLFTTLTTEFNVGLWIIAYLTALESDEKARTRHLSVLTVLGLFLRTVDVVFILMAVAVHVLYDVVIRRDRTRALSSIKAVGLTLILSAPIFAKHYQVTFDYLYRASFGPAAAAWKSLGGVSSKFDVIRQYGNYLWLYNPLILPATVLCLILFLYAYRTEAWRERLKKLSFLPPAFAICIPLLLASSLNIQVVFWVYCCAAFVLCECIRFIYQKKSLSQQEQTRPKSYRAIALTTLVGISSIYFLVGSWRYEVAYLMGLRESNLIANEISALLNRSNADPVLATNYYGIGPLDPLGLSLNVERKLSSGNEADLYTKNRPAHEHINISASTNFYITAHENYFFPTHFGINDTIKETAELFKTVGPDIGFRKVTEIHKNDKYFDIWYRPTTKEHLQFAQYNDTWIEKTLAISIGQPEFCENQKLSGNIKIKIMIAAPGNPDFTPPFSIKMQDKLTKTELARSVVHKFGEAEVNLPLNHIQCGNYELVFDKSFSTPTDARHLSAQFTRLESKLRFDSRP